MVKKHHRKGTLFESRNFLLKTIEKNRLKKIIKLSCLKPTDQLLDLGCGEGYFISLIPDQIQVTGLDISRLALERAKEILKNRKNTVIKFGNAYYTNLPEKSFDKIACSEVLEHVPEPQKVMREIYRLLKDDGRAVISVPDERRIQQIVRFVNFFKLNKFLRAARDKKEYDWHLHSADKKFIKKIAQNLFKIKKLARTPPLIGYRFVVSLEKIQPAKNS